MIYISSVYQGRLALRGVAVYVGRPESLQYAGNRLGPLVDCSFLGNPFHMAHENERDHVCELYEKEFPVIVRKNQSKMDRFKLWIKDKDVTLVCWCAPKRCHALTIKEWLEA